jgi:hypothetical protein
LFYTVRGDGKTLAEGKFGAWILGKANIDVSIDGITQLELQTRVEISKRPTVFWAGARIVTRAGKEIPLSDLRVKFENVALSKQPNQDYFGGPVKIVGEEYDFSTPGQPQDDKQPGLVRVDLSGLDAARFMATVGSDYPPGPEVQRRKVYAVSAGKGTEARFLNVIEPYEDKPVIESAAATSADSVRVELTDGRVQEVKFHNFDGDGKHIVMEMTETKDGKVLRQESTEAREGAGK